MSFYGLQTLRQLLPDMSWRAAAIEPSPPIELTGIEVFDKPAFAWRGVHLDVSRHFMPKSFVLKLIDLISMHKCNVLHLHLTDDQGWRMPVEAYPRLVEVGAWRRESSRATTGRGALTASLTAAFTQQTTCARSSPTPVSGLSTCCPR